MHLPALVQTEPYYLVATSWLVLQGIYLNKMHFSPSSYGSRLSSGAVQKVNKNVSLTCLIFV